MLILAGTVAVLIGACLLAAGLYQDKEKEKTQKDQDEE